MVLTRDSVIMGLNWIGFRIFIFYSAKFTIYIFKYFNFYNIYTKRSVCKTCSYVVSVYVKTKNDEVVETFEKFERTNFIQIAAFDTTFVKNAVLFSSHAL